MIWEGFWPQSFYVADNSTSPSNNVADFYLEEISPRPHGTVLLAESPLFIFPVIYHCLAPWYTSTLGGLTLLSLRFLIYETELRIIVVL